jgi:hypothetical protein
MVEMTMQVSDTLADKIKPFSAWLPTIIEISLLKFKTRAVAQATEIIEFLQHNPSPEDIVKFHASEKSQKRLRKLLTLNNEGLLSAAENLELDELEKLEHKIILLKAEVTKKLKKENGV